VALGGIAALAFTGGVGEGSAKVRAAVCAGLEELGIALDPAANAAARGEARIGAAGARAAVLVIPAHEELVVAREVKRLLESRAAR
jgi:acetate kinase